MITEILEENNKVLEIIMDRLELEPDLLTLINKQIELNNNCNLLLNNKSVCSKGAYNNGYCKRYKIKNVVCNPCDFKIN